jgi:hypothetical protein
LKKTPGQEDLSPLRPLSEDTFQINGDKTAIEIPKKKSFRKRDKEKGKKSDFVGF